MIKRYKYSFRLYTLGTIVGVLRPGKLLDFLIGFPEAQFYLFLCPLALSLKVLKTYGYSLFLFSTCTVYGTIFQKIHAFQNMYSSNE